MKNNLSVFMMFLVVGCSANTLTNRVPNVDPNIPIGDFDAQIASAKPRNANLAGNFIMNIIENELAGTTADYSRVNSAAANFTTSQGTGRTPTADIPADTTTHVRFYAPVTQREIASGNMRFIYVEIKTTGVDENAVFTVEQAYAFEGVLTLDNTALTPATVFDLTATPPRALANDTALADFTKLGSQVVSSAKVWDKANKTIIDGTTGTRLFALNSVRGRYFFAPGLAPTGGASYRIGVGGSTFALNALSTFGGILP